MTAGRARERLASRRREGVSETKLALKGQTESKVDEAVKAAYSVRRELTVIRRFEDLPGHQGRQGSSMALVRVEFFIMPAQHSHPLSHRAFCFVLGEHEIYGFDLFVKRRFADW